MTDVQSRGSQMQTEITKSQNGKYRNKRRRLFTREDLDGRTRAALQFDALVQEQIDAGVDHYLAEAYAGVVLSLRDLNARRLLGEHIDSTEQSLMNSSLIRLEAKMKKQPRPNAKGKNASKTKHDKGSTPISDLINQQDQKEREVAS